MHPMFIVAIPIVLLIIGMVLNSTGLSFDQPRSSPEQDPAKRSVAELDAYRRFFDVQRKQAVKRQQRVSQYAWLLIIATIGSFIGLYMYTVNKTSVATRVMTLQTLPTEEGKETVLSITLRDGTNVKYLIKPPTGETAEATKQEGLSKDKVSSYEISQLGTAFILGGGPVAPGIAIKVSN
jgi:uncharacterized membrane protein